MKSRHLKTILLSALMSVMSISLTVVAAGAAQQDEYEKQWAEVKKLERAGKPRSAIDLVNAIYKQALKNDDQAQMLKALEYSIRLSMSFEEDYFQKGIARINEELPKFSAPSTQILHSLKADLYLGFYSRYRYLILDRTDLADYETNDIESWSQKQFAEAIFHEYERSLQDAYLLQNTPASEFSAILNDNDSLDIFRPTLFDILAYHALNFYKNDEFMLWQAATRFEIDDPQMLDFADSFVRLDIKEVESFSLNYHALKLYQDLIAFHLNDQDPAALVDIDLDRLEFVLNNAVFIEKEKAYKHTLEQMEARYIGKAPVTEIYYNIALHYQQSALDYDPLISEDHQRDLLIAEQYCENAIKEFPESYGASQCKALLQRIREKSLDCQMEYANIPGKAILSSVSFKNVTSLFLRIIPVDPEIERSREYYYDQEQKLKHYRTIRPVKQWSVELPVENDHNRHTTELALPPLPEGYYSLMISDDPSFDKNKGIISFCNFWMTNISYIKQEQENGDISFFVIDRMSGQKKPGVKARVFKEYYDRNSRSNQFIEAGSYTSDADGSFTIPAKSGASRRLMLDLQTEIDRFTSPTYFYSSGHRPQEDKPREISYFFTDRSIYRPGQTIYFKGILLEKTGDHYKILENKPTTVEFYDVNHQKISELQLSTNEYGSVHGSFTAPMGVLTGNMRIRNESGSVNISVEEYKRPKFQVVFDPVKGSYKLGEEVRIEGKAIAYAGNAVDHAQVKYRVVRNAYFPFRYYWGDYYPESPETEIARGEMKTDANGDFEISFTALPDRSMKFMGEAVFNFSVHVDVTDISGETHSGENSVAVGEKSLLIETDIPDELNALERNKFSMKTTNLNGEDEPAEVAVEITKLKSPVRVLKTRSWTDPDVVIIDEEEFNQLFPDREYKNENDKSEWETIRTVYAEKINTAEVQEIELEKLDKWEQGAYKVVMKSEDIFGEEVEMTEYFILYNATNEKPPLETAAWFAPLKTSIRPGEKASVLIGTSYKNVPVLMELFNKNGLLKRDWIKLSDEQQLIEVPASEEDRGGLWLSFTFVSHNEVHNLQQVFHIPYNNRDLDISFETFRDKLLPGQEEQWNIRIRDYKGDKVAAEMLAAMYDASLDDIKDHTWNFSLQYPSYKSEWWSADGAFGNKQGNTIRKYVSYQYPDARTYDHFDWEGIYGGGYGGLRFGGDKMFDGLAMSVNEEMPNYREPAAAEYEAEEDVDMKVTSPEDQKSREVSRQETGEVQIRRNLQETAFFFPDLKTNKDGEVIISFTMPESLTTWKMMGLAYTNDLKFGQISNELKTQKDLMIVPNQPRFFREGDEIWFSAKVVNMSEEELHGQASLQLFDAISMKSVDAEFENTDNELRFTAAKGNSSNVSWKLNIPANSNPVIYRVVATAGDFSDGEEMMIPVLTNRMLVTESMPLPVKGNETREFYFEKMTKTMEESSSLSNYSYTLEFTSNPAWYAVQALPYLMEYPYECSEQIFNRVYANGLATHIVDKQPQVRNVFESWKTASPEALQSKLEQNEDLKYALLEETPWVMQAKNESDRKKRIALLFDLNKMSNELSSAMNKLQQKQLSNGGWPWFAGGPDSRYITQYIIAGFGKMRMLGIIGKADPRVNQMVAAAMRYMDNHIFEDFTLIKDKHPEYREEKHLNKNHIQYLYARSFFSNEYYLLEKHKEAYMYFKEQLKKYWGDYDKYLQGMMALALHRMGDKPMPQLIMASIKEHALFDDEMGMYWRQDAGYYWYEAPIETQALLIEAFDEIMDDQKSVELMKTWLLKQKQTQDWETTKATADACYALLLKGTNLIAEEGDVIIHVGGQLIDHKNDDGSGPEAGTGYFSHRWPANEVTDKLADVTVTKSNEGIAWGAVYWQYFEDLDKITPHASPLSIVKKLFVERYTDEGPVLEVLKDGDALEAGQRVVSRIEIMVDRDMEFVHMKDMRAAALEPVNALSGYRWQGGLGYYESIRDASVNFFFSYLRKGTWVFEYRLNVTQKGNFSNGITTIQCMYAPEFAAHSEGIKITVE